MPLAPMQQILADAQRRRYAVCYCESWNLESLQGVTEAAEETRSPAIVGFNGGFLAHSSRRRPEGLSFYAGFAAALKRSTVPVAFLLNESTDAEQMEEALRLGFTAVMPDNEGLDEGEYRALVRRAVSVARSHEAAVEAQAGHLPAGAEGHGVATDPELAARFAAETGIDALAVAVGNVHILTDGKCRLDLDAVRRTRERTGTPLVLHGGTGIAADDLQAAIRAGITKVNFGTGLKQVYLEAVRNALERYRFPLSPHPFLGMGGNEDIMTVGRAAVKHKASELMVLCGSAGKA